MRGGEEMFALARFRTFVERYPDSVLVPPAMLAIADTLFRQGSWAEAERRDAALPGTLPEPPRGRPDPRPAGRSARRPGAGRGGGRRPSAPVARGARLGVGRGGPGDHGGPRERCGISRRPARDRGAVPPGSASGRSGRAVGRGAHARGAPRPGSRAKHAAPGAGAPGAGAQPPGARSGGDRPDRGRRRGASERVAGWRCSTSSVGCISGPVRPPAPRRRSNASCASIRRRACRPMRGSSSPACARISVAGTPPGKRSRLWPGASRQRGSRIGTLGARVARVPRGTLPGRGASRSVSSRRRSGPPGWRVSTGRHARTTSSTSARRPRPSTGRC